MYKIVYLYLKIPVKTLKIVKNIKDLLKANVNQGKHSDSCNVTDQLILHLTHF